MSSAQERPQIYLITPPVHTLSLLTKTLSELLDAAPIACVRLAAGTNDADDISRAADIVREICHARDVPVVLDGHPGLVEQLGLDGVHISEGAKALRSARKKLGSERILGTHAGLSRHDGMTAGEAGADYITFGPVGDTGLGDSEFAETDLFEWWSLMIELPVIAEGGLTLARARELSPYVDFVALGSEVWRTDDPLLSLKAFEDRLAI